MAITRTGPITIDPHAVALGLAQIRVGDSATNIANDDGVLTVSDSIGALANTSFNGETEFWRLESGFPLLEDLSLPIRERASLECAFKEIGVKNLGLARGLDPADIDAEADDEIGLGGLSSPEFIRMEAVYTFPNRLKQMVIIFPRANVVSSMAIELQAEDAAAIPITFEAKRADSGLDAGDATWDEKPLGTIVFRAGEPST
jgi:hypothetical protein